jgi:hypothetical protein
MYYTNLAQEWVYLSWVLTIQLNNALGGLIHNHTQPD